ncbi:hypothetical protein [Nostoc sp. FACHB-190]|uniref:transposase-like zinc-binding domain-containing protein n=1 Tax=Nostoc sp. FACHB-190 TaxID=2692838 RepID=UPI001686503E|nr:hypothetical protein [Nostoc sp. FACHB-190]MBD2303202.1 hypothetical protein [Nostoc sp. FACHB-190]
MIQLYFGLGAICGGFVAYLVGDSKSQKELRKVAKVAKNASDNLHSVINKYESSKAQTIKLNLELSALKDELKEARNTINNLGHAKIEGDVMIAHLNSKLDECQIKIEKLSRQNQLDVDTISRLETELDQWETTFHAKVEESANYKFQLAKQGELEKIYHEHDSITSEAMQLFRRLQNWGEKVSHGHASKAEIIKSLASGYNQNLDEVSKAIASERQTYLEQIELLNERIAQLQRELQGDLLEPVYRDFGFNESGRIANAIVQWLWLNKRIPLKVMGVEESDLTVTAGYSYSRTISVDALAKLVNDCSSEIAKSLGIHSIESARKLDITDCLAVEFRRERPRSLREDEIYRIMERAENFTQVVRKYHNHQSGGKPTLRLMSGTGGGKSLIAKILIDGYCQHEDGWEIWLSDPMDGSDEDYWELPKVATDKNSAKQAFKIFANEFDSRAAKQSPYAQMKVLGVFDEFDKQHPDSDKQRVKKIWTAIRHQNMRLILMGQSSEVGSNHWTWDEMKNCTLLFIGDAIDTAIKHYKDIGWDLKTKNLIQKNYKAIYEWMEAKNENLSPDKRYRVTLLVCGQTWRFLEVPPAIVGTVLNNKSFVVSRHWESVSQESIISVTLKCPYCGSENIKKNGHSSVKQRWQCRDCSKNWQKS